MAGRAPATARDKTSFAATCSLLSQYLKEKKGALQGLGGLAMAPAPAADSPIVVAGAGALRPPTTMNLLSALDAPAEEPSDAAKATIGEPKDHDKRTAGNPREAAGDEAQQLTIFYGGKVVVFDKFPATKVKDLLQIVNPGGDGVDKAGATVPTQNLPTPSHSSLSDLPIARSNSLHRFLEKRKDRITAKAPYQVNSSVGVEAPKQAAGVEKKPWLGLGTVKQEI
ncbi:protein TIFY 10c-like isoform X1 [Miscanthus floridulus]|uniref:protein TIFY 10c-like isoform X1 n=1 Tax=Miscanthus floridulus TaxID=154761 RepID=UPI0034589CEB